MTGNAPGSERIVRVCGEDKGIQLMQVAHQEITFAVDAGAGTGDSAIDKELFTVTGTVLCAILGICTTDLTSGGAATIELGTSEDTSILAASLGFDSLDDGFAWVTGDADTEVDFATMVWAIVDDVDLGYNIDAADMSDGVIDFYCFWVPISDNGDVVAAGSDVAL